MLKESHIQGHKDAGHFTYLVRKEYAGCWQMAENEKGIRAQLYCPRGIAGVSQSAAARGRNRLPLRHHHSQVNPFFGLGRRKVFWCPMARTVKVMRLPWWFCLKKKFDVRSLVAEATFRPSWKMKAPCVLCCSRDSIVSSRFPTPLDRRTVLVV